MLVDGPRQEFLPGSALPLDQGGALRAGDAEDQLVEIDHRGMSAENGADSGCRLRGGRGGGGLLAVEHFHAVDVGKEHVAENGVVGALRGEAKPLGPGAGDRDFIAVPVK